MNSSKCFINNIRYYKGILNCCGIGVVFGLYHSVRIYLLRGNNTNNYVERSFGTLKDIIFSRTQAVNSVQVFYFITESMERLLGIAHKHPGQIIAKRFFCPGWETVDENSIQQTTC